MSSTFAARLAGSDGRDLRLALVIQGVPFVFQQGRADLVDAVVALAGYGAGDLHTRFKGVGKIEQAAKELDLVQRRMIGGSMTAELHDDDAGTLQALFSPRRRRGTYLVADVDANPSSDTLQVDSAAGAGTLNVPTTVYVGGETIGVAIPDASPTPDEIVGTRGSFGSEPQTHYGAADNGSSVFTSPPSWIGRRVKLIGYFERDDGTTTSSLAMVLDTYRLEEAPRCTGNGCWTLQASHLSDEFAKRKVGSGQRDVHAEDYNDGDLTFAIIDGASRFVVSGSGIPTWVRIRGQSAETVSVGIAFQPVVNQGVDSAMISELISVTGRVIGIRGQNLVEGSPAVVRASDLRHIAILGGVNAGTAVAYALLSRLGDGANGAYDVLPGRARTALGDDGWQFGAGIRDGEVDVDAFEDVGADASQWTFVIDDEYDVEELLRSFCFATDSIWLVDRNGQTTVKRLSEERASSAFALDDDVVIGEPTVDFIEEDIAPRIRLTCNWDTVSQKFLATVNVLDGELSDRYRDHQERLEIESRGLVVSDSGPTIGAHRRDSITTADAEIRLRRMQKQGERGRIRVSCVCHLDALVVDLGDVVTVDLAVPDLEGNLIEDRTARVLKIGPKLDAGEVVIDFEIFEPLLAIAPAAVITGAVGAVVTLEASKDGTATPARMFAVGWTVEQRAADGTYLADYTVIAIPSDTTLQLSAVPFAVTANSDFLVLSEQALADSSAATNTDGLGLRDFAYQMPASEADIVDGSVAAGVANAATRWR